MAKNIQKIDITSLLIIICGGIIQLSAIWLLGFRQNNGILFCCRSVPDAIYHLSLTNEIINRFPPQEPGSTDVIVKNYHYLSNLVLGDLVRVFHLPIIPTVYQYSSILLIILLAGIIITFCKLAKLPLFIQRFALFFFFFAGDINYLLILLRTGKLDFSFTILDNSSRLLTGPPRSFSILLFFAILCLIYIWIKNKKAFSGILAGILTASLMGFKIYTAVPAFAGLIIISLYKRSFLPLIVASILGLFIYLPVNSGAGGLVFTGFWRFENYIVQTPFNLIFLETARTAYLANNNNLRVLFIELIFFLSYLIFNLGSSMLSLIPIINVTRLIGNGVSLFIYITTFSLLFFGLFFIQTTGGANTVQFIITFTIISAIPCAIATYLIYNQMPKKLGIIFIIFIIILTAPRVINEFLENTIGIKNREQFVISNSEIEALNFLANQKPQDGRIAIPPPLAQKFMSQYIPLFSNHPTILAGISDHGVLGLEQRIEENNKLFKNNENNLKTRYIYNPINYNIKLGKEIYNKNNISILEIY